MDNTIRELPERGDLGSEDLSPLCWRPTRIGPPSAWYGHLPFAFWLIAETKPSSLVELGTEWGISYCAFCDAVLRCELSTTCYAIDTWEGDAYAGHYGPEVFDDLNRVHQQRYAGFSTLMRMRFDEAAAYFADHSIDLLHIDGDHGYASVRHDFETWLPKLSERAIVLFHDTNVRSGGFGVWEFWSEVKQRYSSFQFFHGSGLGVLAVGERVSPYIRELCDARSPRAARAREQCALLGERWVAEATHLQQDKLINKLETRILADEAQREAEDKAKRERDGSHLRISAIIPLFNGEAYIKEALQSVLAQTRPADEIIVVDDGSTDSGPGIVERMSHLGPIQLITKSNGGQSSARNLGIRHASGDLVALLDQDDAWYEDHLAELIRPFLEPRVRPLGWVYSNLDEVDEQGHMVYHSCLRMLPFHHPKTDIFACLSFDMFVLPSSSLLSKAAFEAVQGFDEDLTGYEDDDLFLRVFRAGYDNIFLDRPLTRWRIHPRSSSYSYRMAASRTKYLKKLLREFPDNLDRGRAIARDCLAPRFFPLTVRDFRLALLSGSQEGMRRAVDELEFVSRLHKNKIRLCMLAILPVLKRPALCRTLIPFVSALRPFARLVLR